MDIGTIQVELLTFIIAAVVLGKMALNDIVSKLQK
jgi:hypothetical protein